MDTPVGENPPLEQFVPLVVTEPPVTALLVKFTPAWYDTSDEVKDAVDIICEAADIDPLQVTQITCVIEMDTVRNAIPT